MRKESCNAIEIAEKLKEKKYDFYGLQKAWEII